MNTKTCRECGKEFETNGINQFCHKCNLAKGKIVETTDGYKINASIIPVCTRIKCIKLRLCVVCNIPKCNIKKQCGFYNEERYNPEQT